MKGLFRLLQKAIPFRSRRPFNLNDQSSPTWRNRAETAVDLLHSALGDGGENTLKIADLGCGDKKLEEILKKKLARNFHYRGYDLIPQHDDVTKIDLSSEAPSEHFDVCFCLGVIEYIKDLGAFFRRIASCCDNLILSYKISDSQAYPPGKVKKMGWQHHYSRKEIEALLFAAGFRSKLFVTIREGKTGLWLCEK